MSTSNGDTVCDNITIIDDNVLEGEHFFEIQISSTNPQLAIINPASTMMTIQDNEGTIVVIYKTIDVMTHNNFFLQMQQSC